MPMESETFDICASEDRIARAKAQLPAESKIGYIENQALIGLASQRLLRWDCCIFHAVSFIWRGRAFLLTAPSGVGKTTQYLNWQRQFPGEVSMICGDMPVLERREDGTVWVHPSNWNGKEHLGGTVSAPVAGIILLEQGTENRVTPLPVSAAIPLLFPQFVVQLDTDDEIRSLARIMDCLLRAAPVQKLTNRGDSSSTSLLRDTLRPLTGGNDDTL